MDKLIYMIPWIEKGKINATLNFSKELRKVGYKVIYIILPKFKEYIELNNFDYRVLNFNVYDPKVKNKENQLVQLNKLIEKKSKKKFADQILAFRARYKRFFISRELERMVFDSQQNVIETLLLKDKPNLIIIDTFLYRFVIPILKYKIPFLNLNTQLASYFNINYPPVFSRVICKQNPNVFDKIRNLTLWMLLYKKQFYINVKRKIRISTINFINQVRFNKNGKKLHLTSFNKRIKRYGGKYDWGEYGYRLRGKEIVLADAEIDFPLIPKIRKDCCYVGGCVDFSRKEERFDWSIVDKEKTLIYCSVGMLKWNEDVIAKFFFTVINTFQENSQWELIVHIAREEYYRKFINLELSKNIHVYNTVPQIEILSKSSLFISHGGFSSIRESICCGVPLIVCPIGVDQPGNAARIVYHNLGISIDINEMTTQSLLKQVIQTLSNSTIYHSVKKMQKIFLENSKYSEGVKFINNYIRKQNGEK